MVGGVISLIHHQTKTHTMKAEVKYSNGWMLIIPKSGFAPMLFMEWISKFRAGKNWIHNIDDNTDGYFNIRLNMKQELFQEAAEYINANL